MIILISYLCVPLYWNSLNRSLFLNSLQNSEAIECFLGRGAQFGFCNNLEPLVIFVFYGATWPSYFSTLAIPGHQLCTEE